MVHSQNKFISTEKKFMGLIIISYIIFHLDTLRGYILKKSEFVSYFGMQRSFYLL